MIDFIEGQVEYIEKDCIIVSTKQGVGYRIFCPNPYEYRKMEQKRVYTHQHVREDAIQLYGFVQREQRDLFRKLLDVSGIGPRGAIVILAAATPSQIVGAVQREDIVFLTKFPGIGKKTAGRMILDLKDKLKDFGNLVNDEDWGTEEQLFAFSADDPSVSSHQEAAEALKALGYSDAEVNKVMAKLKNEQGTTEQLIKRALQLILTS